MKKSSAQSSLSTRVLQGAFIYLLIFFVLFFTTNLVGTKLNWLFWLLPPFYALYISQLKLSKKLLVKILKERLSAVVILSFIGTSFVYVSFAFIVILGFETLVSFGRAVKQKSFSPAVSSLVILIAPLLYFIITRMYQAGQLDWITTAIAFVVLAAYWFAKRKGFFKRAFLPK